MNKKSIVYIFCLILVFFLGFWLRTPAGRPGSEETADKSSAVSQASGFTCSMHPQIRQPRKGKCPLCAMDLIPVSGDFGREYDPEDLKLSETAEKLAAIETVPVERKFVPAEIRMLGKVSYNEDTLGYVYARFPGRVDKLFVKSAGFPVKKFERLAEVYSSDLLGVEAELVQAHLYKESKPGDATAINYFNSIKEKNLNSGFSEVQINEIIRKGRRDATAARGGDPTLFGILLSITSPISGVVVEKPPVVGKFFDKGDILFTIADLSRVWINVEAYEADLPFLKYGQEVEFTVEACPGRKFSGRISLIQPILDETTRTVKVRFSADNREGWLKPGMFVQAVIRAKMGEGGQVLASSLAGKWICNVHAVDIRYEPGLCEVCGTPLATAESLGLAGGNEKDVEPPLVIPASAPLITGKRAVVYVAVPGKSGVYECREVSLGARSGNYFIVESGLEEGEKVVASGSFKVDSSFQILAKASMMSMPGDDDAEAEDARSEAAGQ